MSDRLRGLIAATHTPFDGDGQLNLDVVDRLAQHLVRHGVQQVFIGGSTGESQSLTVAERLALTQRWMEVANGTRLTIIVHVGANCLADAQALAKHAQQLGAAGVAAHSPSYFKPPTIDVLVECCQSIAAAAPEIPFYYYDIPAMTGLKLSAPEFLDAAVDRIPTLAGLKVTNPDLSAYQRCLRSHAGRFDALWGIDEFLLSALAVGAVGAVGGSYNLAAPIYLRLIDAFNKADLATARDEQFRSVQLNALLNEFGYLGATKAAMEMLGIPVGPPRLPNARLTAQRREEFKERLTRLGFFDWVAPDR